MAAEGVEAGGKKEQFQGRQREAQQEKWLRLHIILAALRSHFPSATLLSFLTLYGVNKYLLWHLLPDKGRLRVGSARAENILQ